MNIWIIAAGILTCIVCSAFFSSAEMSYSACNRLRLENARDDGSKKADRAVKISDRFEDALSAILIGNNLANIAGSSLASILVMKLLGDGYAWVATLVMTVVIIIFSETVPKITAKKNATALAMKYSGAVRFLMVLLSPLVKLVVFLVHILSSGIKQSDSEDADEAVEELQSIIETAEDEEIIDEDRSELVQAAIDFSDVSAYEVMTARVDIQALSVDASPEELLAFVEEARHSRIPVYEDSVDNIVGILYLNRVLKAMTGGDGADIRSLMMEPCYIYKTAKLPQVLECFRKFRQHLAVVSDEYGGTLGVISMEDVLEQIVGDIWDEEDEYEPEIVETDDGGYILDGDMALSDFLELAGIPEYDFEAESETLGGWAMEVLETFPEEGQSFTYEDTEITVLKMEGRRVEKLRIKKLPKEKN